MILSIDLSLASEVRKKVGSLRAQAVVSQAHISCIAAIVRDLAMGQYKKSFY